MIFFFYVFYISQINHAKILNKLKPVSFFSFFSQEGGYYLAPMGCFWQKNAGFIWVG